MSTPRQPWIALAVASALAVLSLVLVLSQTITGSAWHQQTGDIWRWRNYESTWSGREIQWVSCGGDTYQDYYDNLNGVALNNWVSRFGHSTSHYELANSCNEYYWPNYAIWYTTANEVHQHCPGDLCFRPTDCLNSSGQLVNCITSGVKRVLRAVLYVDEAVWDGLVWNQGSQLHIYAHEFGHGMGLEDVHPCGASVMSHGPCTDLVDNGPYPNDVCVPDTLLGFGTGRC